MLGRECVHLVNLFVIGGVEIRKEEFGGGFLGRGGGPDIVFGGLDEVILPLPLPCRSRHGLKTTAADATVAAFTASAATATSAAAAAASSVFFSILVL